MQMNVTERTQMREHWIATIEQAAAATMDDDYGLDFVEIGMIETALLHALARVSRAKTSIIADALADKLEDGWRKIVLVNARAADR